MTTPRPGVCLLAACTRDCTTECREAINRAWTSLRGAQPVRAQPRHTADSITDDALAGLYDDRDELRATVQRLNRRAQEAESKNATYERAVAQWDVSERGTYIPHASLVAIGRAAGTNILGSVRHLKHFQRIERAEAALDAVRKLHRPVEGQGWDSDEPGERYGHIAQACISCGTSDEYAVRWPCDTVRALDAHTTPTETT